MFCMLTVAGTILMSVHWSFSRGFGEYLLKAEAAQLDKLLAQLEQTYAKTGSWQYLADNHRVWFDLLQQNLEGQQLPPPLHGGHPPRDGTQPPPMAQDPPPPPFGENGFDRHGPPLPLGDPHLRHPPWLGGSDGNPPQMPSKFLSDRLQVLDDHKNKVIGFADNTVNSLLLPIKQGKSIIGWLSLQPNELINDHLAHLFVEQQIRNNYQIAGLALLLAIFGALLVTRVLLIPIKRIASGARALTTGIYATRINSASQDELGQLALDFNLLAQTLQNNEQTRKHWIADISHELRTPLAILRGEIEAIQDGIRAASQDQMQSLHTEVSNLTQLVDDLYELSLADLGTNHFQKTSVDLSACLEEAAQSLSRRFADSQLELKINDMTDGVVIIQGDARRLRQVFVNLLENSRRYTHAGGFCEISLACSNSHALVTFADTPPSVPDWALGKLFERLYRVDKSRNRELGGAGLGLAICKAIVNAHQGEIQAFHSQHGGLGIKVSLPLKQARGITK